MRFNAFALVTALLLAVPVPGRAGDAVQPEQSAQYAKRLFAAPLAAKGKSFVCFSRRYDAAHLAQHPGQKVTRMTLLVSAEMVPEDSAPAYSFAVGLNYRDRKGDFETSGSCGHPVASEVSADKLQLACGVDCDGGGLSVEMTNADKSVIVRIEHMSIWKSGASDEDERTGFGAGPDDHVFRLDRVDVQQCRPLMNDEDKAASM